MFGLISTDAQAKLYNIPGKGGGISSVQVPRFPRRKVMAHQRPFHKFCWKNAKRGVKIPRGFVSPYPSAVTAIKQTQAPLTRIVLQDHAIFVKNTSHRLLSLLKLRLSYRRRVRARGYVTCTLSRHQL